MVRIAYSFARAKMVPPAITFPADAPARQGMRECIVRANARLDFLASTALRDAFVSMAALATTSTANVTAKKVTRVTIAS